MHGILTIGAYCTAVIAIATVLYFGVWRVVRSAVRVEQALPTLLAIAEQFQPNSGTSLHDRVQSLQTGQVRQLGALAHIEAHLVRQDQHYVRVLGPEETG